MTNIWLLVSIIGALIIVLAIVFLVMRRKEHREPDYRAFFILGVLWIVIGLVEYFTSRDVSIFFLMGLVFLTIGLSHKNRWGKPRQLLNEKQKKMQKIIMIFVTVLVVLGLVLFLFIAY
jgi:branched-subunit amino acid ABC-type transport system permease component